MASVSDALRAFIITRAKGQCEYCQTLQSIVIDIEVDHIEPESLGGLTDEANLCLSCASCNRFKSNFQFGQDPETGESVPLYHPRRQIWTQHFKWSEEGTHLIGLTPTGRATIERLRINREIAVQARSRWVKAGWHPP